MNHDEIISKIIAANNDFRFIEFDGEDWTETISDVLGLSPERKIKEWFDEVRADCELETGDDEVNLSLVDNIEDYYDLPISKFVLKSFSAEGTDTTTDVFVGVLYYIDFDRTKAIFAVGIAD
jgi:hypothetical protein